MTRFRHTIGLILALALLAMPAGAQASPAAVYRDCIVDGDLDKRYSRSDLKGARDKLGSDADQYSDCAEVIDQAIDDAPKAGASGGGNGSGGGTGGATAPDAAQRQLDINEDNAALERASSGKRPSVDIGGSTVRPGENGLFGLSSAVNELPAPLALSLLALLLLALGGGFLALRRRIPALAGIRLPGLSRVPFPRLRR